MCRISQVRFWECFTIALITLSSLGSPSRAQVRPQFVVFDGLLYQGKPESGRLGLVPIGGIGDLWRPGVSHDTVDEVQIKSLLEHVGQPRGYYYIDIENWPLQEASPVDRQRTIEKLARVMDIARRSAPHARLGFYGILPGITYWPLMRHDSDYHTWLRVNGELQPLAGRVDAVFPSLYTFYEDVEGWKSYARQTLTEARRYGKPVYAFLWPEFHDSNPMLRGHEVPPAYWRAELELCSDLADGVVLWGGWQQHWNENAAWWHETLAFMDRLKDLNRLDRTDRPHAR